MTKFRNTIAIAAVTGAAFLAVAGTSSAFTAGPQAAPSNAAWCTGGDLEIQADDAVSPQPASKLFHISFKAKEGRSCQIGGSLSNVRFLDGTGQALDVPLTGGQNQEYVEVPVDSAHSAAVYVATPVAGLRVNPAAIRFDLPGKGSLGDAVTVAWPSGLGLPVTVTDLMVPVS